MIYNVYSISNSPYQLWQAELLEYSMKKVNQQGITIRLCSKENEFPERTVAFPKTGHTIITPDYSHTEKGRWRILNKPGSLRYLFENYSFNDDDILVMLDPDMIFVKQWNPFDEVKQGTAHGQFWFGSSTFDNAIMYPFVIYAKDMKKIYNDVYKFSLKQYIDTGDWISDMSGFVLAKIKNNINMSYDTNVCICNNWENKNEESPIIHYCQPIKRNDSRIWWKWKYKHWDIPPDPDLAENRVDKITLQTIHKYIKQRRTK